jgi:hypothetical protein
MKRILAGLALLVVALSGGPEAQAKWTILEHNSDALAVANAVCLAAPQVSDDRLLREALLDEP